MPESTPATAASQRARLEAAWKPTAWKPAARLIYSAAVRQSPATCSGKCGLPLNLFYATDRAMSEEPPMTTEPLRPAPLLETSIPGWPVRRGKVRDIYDLGDRLLLVATDRISAFDWVLPQRHPRQRARADANQPVLVRIARRTEPFALGRRGGFRPAPPASIPSRSPAAACWSARPRSCRSNASSAAIWPARAGRNIGRAAPFAACHCRPACAKATACPSRSSPPRRRKKAATTSTSRSSRMAESVGARRGRRTAPPQSGDLPPRRGATPGHAASLSPTRNSNGAVPTAS